MYKYNVDVHLYACLGVPYRVLIKDPWSSALCSFVADLFGPSGVLMFGTGDDHLFQGHVNFGENTFSNTKKTETRQAMSAKSFPQQSEATFKDGSQILSRASNFKPPNMPGMLPCFFWWPILRTFPLHQRFQLFPWRKMKRCMAIFLVILSALLLGHLGNIWMCLKTGGYRDTLQMACWWTIEFGGFPSKQTNVWLSCLYRLAPHRMLWLFAYRKPASIGGFCFFWFYRVVY